VETRVNRIGRSSLGMSHRMTAGADGRLVGDVRTVLVTYDYQASAPIPVPDEWRARIAEHEGRVPGTDAPRPAAAAAG
jgi:acyl-CoA thioesterase FadM